MEKDFTKKLKENLDKFINSMNEETPDNEPSTEEQEQELLAKALKIAQRILKEKDEQLADTADTEDDADEEDPMNKLFYIIHLIAPAVAYQYEHEGAEFAKDMCKYITAILLRGFYYEDDSVNPDLSTIDVDIKDGELKFDINLKCN